MFRQLALFSVSPPILAWKAFHVRSYSLLCSKPFPLTSTFRQINLRVRPQVITMTARKRNKRTAATPDDGPKEPEVTAATTRAGNKRATATKTEKEVKEEDRSKENVKADANTAAPPKQKRKTRKKPVVQPEPLTVEQKKAMLHKASLIKQKLEEVYPKAPEGFLHHTSPFTLLVAVLLSAQSLDVVVNEVTPELFKQGGTPAKMAALGDAKVLSLIKRVGLAPTKAKNIVKLSTKLVDEFDGEVPQTFEELESLPGVGHKTASVVMMQAFGLAAFPVDTHIWRLACRWGIGDAKSVEKTEENLKQWFPNEKDWGELHVRIILFGREYCPARKHDMEECPICRFAATAESLEMNRKHKDKFVGATGHKDPFSIREVAEEESEADDEDDGDYDMKSTKPAKNARAKSKIATRKSTRKRTRVQLENNEVEEDDDEDFESPKEAKRARTRASTRSQNQSDQKGSKSDKVGKTEKGVRRSTRKKT